MDGPLSSYLFFFWPIFELSNLFIDIEKQIDWKGMEKSLIFLHICKKCGT